MKISLRAAALLFSVWLAGVWLVTAHAGRYQPECALQGHQWASPGPGLWIATSIHPGARSADGSRATLFFGPDHHRLKDSVFMEWERAEACLRCGALRLRAESLARVRAADREKSKRGDQ